MYNLSGTERVDDYWHRGRTLEGGLEGTFPPSYCWEPDPSNYVTALKGPFTYEVHTEGEGGWLRNRR